METLSEFKDKYEHCPCQTYCPMGCPCDGDFECNKSPPIPTDPPTTSTTTTSTTTTTTSTSTTTTTTTTSTTTTAKDPNKNTVLVLQTLPLRRGPRSDNSTNLRPGRPCPENGFNPHPDHPYPDPDFDTFNNETATVIPKPTFLISYDGSIDREISFQYGPGTEVHSDI